MKRFFVAAVLVLAVMFSLQPALAGDKLDAVAVSVAESFLDLIDHQDYQASWEQGSFMLQREFSPQEWRRELEPIRPLFGTPLSRSLIVLRQRERHPGYPDGQYALISFESTFSQKAQAVETLLLVKEPDGEWRVLRYRFQ
mgnify:CR=1 FL=1